MKRNMTIRDVAGERINAGTLKKQDGNALTLDEVDSALNLYNLRGGLGGPGGLTFNGRGFTGFFVLDTEGRGTTRINSIRKNPRSKNPLHPAILQIRVPSSYPLRLPSKPYTLMPRSKAPQSNPGDDWQIARCQIWQVGK